MHRSQSSTSAFCQKHRSLLQYNNTVSWIENQRERNLWYQLKLRTTIHENETKSKEEIIFPLSICWNCPAIWRTHPGHWQLSEGSIDLLQNGWHLLQNGCHSQMHAPTIQYIPKWEFSTNTDWLAVWIRSVTLIYIPPPTQYPGLLDQLRVFHEITAS